MTANYLISDYQKSTLAMLERLDRNAVDFFTTAPFVIDCRDDKEAFNLRISETMRAVVMDRLSSGHRYVSFLGSPVRGYADEKLQSRYRELDPDGVKMVRSFRDDWRSEVGRKAYQSSKLGTSQPSYGVDIILPIANIRLSYDLSSLNML
jgi:hypothetical protein